MVYVLGAIGAMGTLAMLHNMRKSRQLRRAEIRQNEVEVLDVWTTRAAWVGSEDDEAPILMIDVGKGKLLVLSGQWQWDSSLFTPQGSDRYFPADSFAIVRLCPTGTVVSVHVSGNRLPEIPTVTFAESGLKSIAFTELKECMLLDLAWPVGQAC